MYYDTNKATMTDKCTHPPAVSMATAVCWSNTDGIAQCGMPRATPEATEHRHRATTCTVLPQRPPGQQANKQQSTNAPAKLAVLMAMAMRRYVTACCKPLIIVPYIRTFGAPD